MEQNSSFNNQLRREITARAVMNKKIKMLKADIDGNNKKIYDLDKEIDRIKKVIRKRGQKNKQFQDLYLKINKLKFSKIDIKNEIEALDQIILHMEKLKDGIKLKIKQLKNKIKNLPKENPFDFTEYVNKQKEENEIDLGLFLELAEENKIIQSSTNRHSH